MVFFKAIECTENFLSKPVGEWMHDSGFKEAKETVDNMAVVNDSAERGVKLCHDFLNSAWEEEQLQIFYRWWKTKEHQIQMKE